VRASANFTRPDFRYPASLREEILAVPGVRAVESYRGARFEYRDDRILLMSIEVGPMMDRTRREMLQGDDAAMRRGLVDEGKCAVSDNFYRRFHLGVGQSVDLPAPGGVVSIPIVAVFKDFSSDRGSVMIDRALFVRLFKDDRVDTFDVSVRKGRDPLKVRELIREKLAGRFPALISSRQEFTAEIGGAIDGFYVLIRITVLLALAVAFLGIVTSLLISVAERTREIGILKALGAAGSQIRRSVVYEAVAVSLVGLTISIPIGVLIARFNEGTVAEVFAGWRMPDEYPVSILLQLLILLPLISTIAAWLPARQAAAVKVTEAIEYE
jgi:putative ABC transport system permease protein